MKEINDALLRQFRAQVAADPAAAVLNGALAKTDLADLSFVPMQAALHDGPFAVEVKTRGITAQKQSGRCWLFAALNLLREKVAEKCNLDEKFELSQNYLSFYDKLEKANNFLEMVIEQAKEPVKGQRMQYVLRGMVDGGYWCEAAHLVEKYGVVPKTANPESYQSEHTARFLATLNRLLRKDARELRDLVLAGKDPCARKEAMLAEVYKAECIAFGTPVDHFDFTWRDKDKKYHVDRNLTPKEFYDKYVGISLADFQPVINEPTPDKGMDRLIAFHAVENMVGKDMVALNLNQKALEDLCIKQLKAGQPVWFACDAGACGPGRKASGIRPAYRRRNCWAASTPPWRKATGCGTGPARPPMPCCSPVWISMRTATPPAGRSRTPGARTWARTVISSAPRPISKSSCTKRSSTRTISLPNSWKCCRRNPNISTPGTRTCDIHGPFILSCYSGTKKELIDHGAYETLPGAAAGRLPGPYGSHSGPGGLHLLAGSSI